MSIFNTKLKVNLHLYHISNSNNMNQTNQMNKNLESSFKNLFDIIHRGGDLNLSASETFEKYKENILATNSTPVSQSKASNTGTKRTKKKSVIELWAADNKDIIKEWCNSADLLESGKKPGYMKGRGEVWKQVTDEVKEEYTDKASSQSS